jgi:hypothetical protein
MVTIKQAATLTGLPEHTLRAWERRYGLISPVRTASGYRLYDDEALDRVRLMQELVASGLRPGQAALEALSRDLVAPRDGTATLVAAAAALDSDAVAAVLDDEFARGSFEAVVDGWLMPALGRLGRAWARGEISVAGEHLVSQMVMRRLAAVFDAAPPGEGPAVVVGAPPGIEHELGLLAFAAAARRGGLHVVYLGARVPAESWRLAVAAVGARAAVTSLHRRRDAPRLAAMAGELAGFPDLELWVGGRHQDRAPAPFRPLGHSIADAAARLVAG